MSKRSSTNAKYFSGITWGFGVRSKKKSENEEKKTKEREHRIDEQWKRICEKLNFVLNAENKMIHDKLKSEFKENRQLRLKSLKNIACFKIYCQEKRKQFTLENYFESNYNILDFKKKYPEIYLKSKKPKVKSKTKIVKKIASSANTLMNNVSDEIVKKLQKIKNGL